MEIASNLFVVLAYFAAIGFFVFGVDDFLFDLQFLRYLRRTKKDPNITLGQLNAKPEKYIAIMVPAWKEGGVVNRMADYAVKVLDYERYDIFIGVYPNDPETSACVDAIARACPKIHKVVCPNPGPTSKADCLNAIYRAIRMREIPEVREYEILALHDSEDVLHPLTLKIYNYFVPDRVDMGQIPVFPLEHPPLTTWIGNTYMDDFSELHLKDMFARQEIGGVVPSAGVGTAFGRRAVDFLADHNHGDPFLVGNLTEDYFIGIQLKRAGFSACFINYPLDRTIIKKGPDGKEISRRQVTEYVAVRENFPTKFWDAVRQRSRWILGISMQCWELAGWHGSIPVRYTLFRDRKAPLVHMINAAGYIVILSWLVEWGLRMTPFSTLYYWRPLFSPDSLLWGIILVDTAFLVYRLLAKVYYVRQIYGWKQALFAVPRYPIGNAINFFATCRALWMYLQNRVFGKQLVWLKTEHVFPTYADLAEYSASIEDLLVRDGIIPRDAAESLLAHGEGTSLPSQLLNLRLIEEEQFTELWARFSGLQERTLTLEELGQDALEGISEARFPGCLPFRKNPAGGASVAFLEPPSKDVLAALQDHFGGEIDACLITRTNMRITRDFAYSAKVIGRGRPALSSKFLEIDPEKRRVARELQHRTGRRFSDLLVDMGLVAPELCREACAEVFGAEPRPLLDAQLDDAAFDALGPVYCFLHRIAPIKGGALVFQDILHPETLREIRERLGAEPRLVTDVPSATRRFLRAAHETVKPEEAVLDWLVAAGKLSVARASEVRAVASCLNEPMPDILREFAGLPAETVRGAFLGVARLSPAPDFSEIPPAGIMRPDFEASTGAKVVEGSGGKVTISLEHFLRPSDFSQVCTRLNRCAVRFVAQ